MGDWSLEELNSLLAAARHQGDELADIAIATHGRDREFAEMLKRLATNRHLEEVDGVPAFQEVVKDIITKVAGFDQTLLRQGQQVFRKYAVDIMPILGLYSLPYCYAAEEGSKVLILSRYLTEDPAKRLKETGEFVFEVAAPDSFENEGSALVAIAKVRLIHSYVRRHVAPQISYEIPVNQEDMLGTNLSFSLIVIRGLRKLGINMSPSEEKAYLYLWWCVGQLLGMKAKLLPQDMKKASLVEAAIRKRQFRRNEGGVELTKALLRQFEAFWSFPLLSPAEMVAHMVGDGVRAFLDLPNPGIRTLSAVQIVSFRNSLRKFTEDSYGQLFKMGDFEGFRSTPESLKI